MITTNCSDTLKLKLKEETKRINSVLIPDLDKLFQFIKEYDPRLCQQVAHVGSYYQGLKVRRSDEFDYTVYIDIDMNEDWVVRYGSAGVFYGFRGRNSELEHLAHTIPQVGYNTCSSVSSRYAVIILRQSKATDCIT